MNNDQDNKPEPFQKVLKPGRNAILFLLSLSSALLITYLIRDPGFSDSQDYVLFLLLFAVGLWLTEAIPPFAVALFIMAFIAFALGDARFNEQPQDIAKYLQTFSSSIVWLILGGFFLAEAMSKTGLDADLFRFSIRLSGHRPKHILLGLMLTTMAASMILSNTATTAMVLASITPLLNKLGKNPFSKALLTGIPIAASVGGMGTIIGSSTNAIAAGALESAGKPVSFLEWMIIGVPLAILLTFASWWMLSKKNVKDNQPIDIDLTPTADPHSLEQRRKRRVVMVVLLVTVCLWLTSSIHELSVSAVAAIPIVFLTMTGILKAPEIRNLPWDTLLLVAGGLSLGLALQETGMLQHFTSSLTSSSYNQFLLLCGLGFGTMVFSTIMSNTATTTILVPLGLQLLPSIATEAAMVVALSASTALLLPVSTPPNAIAYGTGMIEQKDFLPGGLFVGLLGPALIIALVLLIV